MPKRISGLLEDIKNLLGKIDKKLDKILNHQTLTGQSLSQNQKEDLTRSLNDFKHSISLISSPSKIEPQSQLDTLAAMVKKLELTLTKNFVPGTFASLPEHLRQTMEAIVTLGEATALEVSRKTGRSRAAESDYLNQLADRGFLKKTRRGREVVFQVFSLHTICPLCGSRVPLNVNFCSFCGAMLNQPKQTPAFMHNQYTKS